VPPGPGSCSHMMSAICQKSGLKTGLYTSPHLVDFRERIRIDGRCISEESVIAFVAEHSELIDDIKPSFFEITVAMAFDHFAKEEVDIAIIETGLGGRLDSTNIINPILSIITNIGFDHMDMLGDTLEKIASEKAGIIKAQTPVLIGERQKLSTSVFLDKANEMKARISFAEDLQSAETPTYQLINQRTCRAAINILNDLGLGLKEDEIEDAFKNCHDISGLMGRWQILQDQPKVICDTGHNIDGLSLSMKQLSQENFKQLHIIWSSVQDKDLELIFPLLPKEAEYYWCQADIPRAMDQKLLQEHANRHDLFGNLYNTPVKAYENAMSKANSNDLVFIGGSTFTVGDLFRDLEISTCVSSPG